ncbi:hypothetical protein BW152_00495 [Lactococcus lactis]|uniref:DUF916 domain-containing protein n=1 Tax=Lactococcus lactis TaxID=1358 RepID=UPI000BF8B221|nr:DUF916 domain-containing protein [Lactococcus lactis]PFG85580.1 hypothetical protein BW152_00495 [Lactococcus lactis]
MKKIITLLFLFVLNISGSQVLAENNQPSSGTYSVSAIPSIHQTEGIESFFDIRWTPSYTEKFGILITNKSDKAQTYQIQVNKARTNKNGIIDYSDTSPELKSSRYQLTQMIQLPKEVTVPAGQSQKVEGSLNFPQASFNGILMSGIHVSEKKAEDNQSAVSNTVAYNLPFVVRGDSDVRPEAKLTLKKVSLEAFSSTQSSLDIGLSNEEATLLKESRFQAKITSKKNDKVIVQQSSKLDLTPETDFVYPVKLPKNLPAGDYQLVLKVTHGKDNWDFKHSLHVTGAEAKSIQQRAGVKDYSWLIYVFLILLIIIIFVILFFVRKTRKRNKQIEISNRRSKRKRGKGWKNKDE